MWNRIQVTKHATYTAADEARREWLDAHPTSAVDFGAPLSGRALTCTYKVRVKKHANDFKFIVWQRADKGDS